jgi:hypothetical protein
VHFLQVVVTSQSLQRDVLLLSCPDVCHHVFLTVSQVKQPASAQSNVGQDRSQQSSFLKHLSSSEPSRRAFSSLLQAHFFRFGLVLVVLLCLIPAYLQVQLWVLSVCSHQDRCCEAVLQMLEKHVAQLLFRSRIFDHANMSMN